MRFYYTEPGWEMEDVPVEGGFGMDVTRCVVAEFFNSLGLSDSCQLSSAIRTSGVPRIATSDFRYHVPYAGAT